MTDIIERLRDRNDLRCLTASMPPQFIKDALCQEAADEIERLRKALSFFFEMNDNGWGLKYTHIEAQRLAVAELTREKSDD